MISSLPSRLGLVALLLWGPVSLGGEETPGQPEGPLSNKRYKNHLLPSRIFGVGEVAGPSLSDSPVYPWKKKIVATIFWVGEDATQNNPVHNRASSWDQWWEESFGGYDDPDPAARAWDYRPRAFEPQENPFYIALPYNDLAGWARTKSEAYQEIPWFEATFRRPGRSVLHNRWVAIRHAGKICYAQWSDCGPFHTDDWEYVFGEKRPKNQSKNGGAGIDISPAVRDYLGLQSGEECDWRFVELHEIPYGPWGKFGTNNHFVKMKELREIEMRKRFARLREEREAWIRQRPRSQ
ncbi:MAG: hypothetical protein AAF555_04150 [Verrucomicrobiota bacterium]